MSRLITFGCSFTSYHWPTYADYIGLHFDSHFNYANTGSGNKRIFNLVTRHLGSITKDDFVIIQWSGIERDDKILPETHDLKNTYTKERFNSTEWYSNGSVYELNGLFNENYKKNYFSLVEQYEMLISYSWSLKFALDHIGCRYKFIFMLNPFIRHDTQNLLGEPLGVYYNKVDIRQEHIDEFKLSKNYDLCRKELFDDLKIEKESLTELQWRMEMESAYNWYVDSVTGGFHKDYHPTSNTHFKISLYYMKKFKIDLSEDVDLNDCEKISKDIDSKYSNNMSSHTYKDNYETYKTYIEEQLRSLKLNRGKLL